MNQKTKSDFKIPPERLDEAIDTLKQILKERDSEPAAAVSQPQEEAPVLSTPGASTKPTWDDVLNKLHQLEARLVALEGKP